MLHKIRVNKHIHNINVCSDIKSMLEILEIKIQFMQLELYIFFVYVSREINYMNKWINMTKIATCK